MGKKIVIKLIRFYQLVLSPYKGRSYFVFPVCSRSYRYVWSYIRWMVGI